MGEGLENPGAVPYSWRVAYAVKELIYTLQGEGAHAGRPAVFLRFAGCNLWSGREEDRHLGPGACSAWPAPMPTRAPRRQSARRAISRPLVVCTGGEPLLQLDGALVEALHAAGFEVAVETNGTLESPPGIDWICVSPKAGSELRLRSGHELKLIYPQPGAEPERYEGLDFEHFYLQPLDGPEGEENTRLTLAYCLEHPRWRLSLQTQKLLGIP